MTSDMNQTLLLLSAAAACLVAGCILCQLLRPASGGNTPERGKGDWTANRCGVILTVGIAVALILRVVIAMSFTGYATDIYDFGLWATRAHNLPSLDLFYSDDYFCDYPPGYLYVLKLIGWVQALFDIQQGAADWLLTLKLPAILCDCLAGAVLYLLASRRMRPGAALVVSFSYLFNPAVIADSAAWGQIDGILALFLLLSLDLFLEKRMVAASVVFALGLMIKLQAIVIAPVVLAAFILAIRENPGKGIRDLVISLALCVAVVILLFLPFSTKQGLWWCILHTQETLGSYEYASLNALNLFTMLGGNWLGQETPLFFLDFKTWGTINLIALVAFTVLLFLKGKGNLQGKGDWRQLPLLASVLVVGFYTFSMRVHDRYLFCALLLVLFAFLLYRDRRLFYSFICLSAVQFADLLTILVMRHLKDDEAGTFLMCLFMVVSCIYLFYVSWQICVQGKTQPFAASQDIEKELQARLTPLMDKVSEPAVPGAAGVVLPGVRTRTMEKKDWLIVGIISLLFAALSFTHLGNTHSVEKGFTTTDVNTRIMVDLGEAQQLDRFQYFIYAPVNGTVDFYIEGSRDGETWFGVLAPDKENQCPTYGWDGEFNWEMATLQNCNARFLRLTIPHKQVTLFEFGFRDPQGQLVPVQSARTPEGEDCSAIFDEQELVPLERTYLNSTYFDEIYHARTAYEMLHGLPWYETTHPPLGKVFIALGIQILGMTPFGWRFMGALAGVLMLPMMYLLAQLLFRRRLVSTLATLLLALDCMHFVQTRVASIDSFLVLFLLCMVYFLFRYLLLTDMTRQPVGRTLPPLFAAGFFMGMACATKWIGFYAALGVAVVLFAYWVGLYRQNLRRSEPLPFGRPFGITVAACLFAFILIPALVYLLSYVPQFLSDGAFSLKRFWDAQTYILSYHSNLKSIHSYSSPWWQWLLSLKSLWYFSGTSPAGASTISCLGNPAIWWTGLAAFILSALRIQGGRDKETDPRGQRIIWTLIILYLALLLPWTLVQRTTYIYHYFSCVPLVILAICWLVTKGLDGSLKSRKRTLVATSVLVVASLAVFVLLFPVISGMDITPAYAHTCEWFPDWTLWS